jgi:hypothetical protein
MTMCRAREAGRTKSSRAQWVARKYQLEWDEYRSMLEACGGKCEICHEPFDGEPHVDHDHSDGRVRGLLCRRCNFGLGNFRDEASLLRTAIKYLNKNSA